MTWASWRRRSWRLGAADIEHAVYAQRFSGAPASAARSLVVLHMLRLDLVLRLAFREWGLTYAGQPVV